MKGFRGFAQTPHKALLFSVSATQDLLRTGVAYIRKTYFASQSGDVESLGYTYNP